jgi:hypothetical protein
MACGHEATSAPPPASPPPTTSPGPKAPPSTNTTTREAPRPSLPASPGATLGLAETTAEAIPAAIAALPLPAAARTLMARAWSGPPAYALLFILGFLVAFAIGAAVAWPRYDPAVLLAAGRFADVITVVDATSSPPADWQRLKGHALHARGDLDGMLKAYQLAVADGAVDDLALERTVAALGVDKVASLAVKTLEDWPGGAAVDKRLLAASADPVWLRRHRATEVLGLRPSASPGLRLQAEVRNAVADVRSDVCEHKLDGVKALARLADNQQAWPWLKKAGAWNAVYDINAAVILKHRCLSEDIVRRAEKALAKVERE